MAQNSDRGDKPRQTTSRESGAREATNSAESDRKTTNFGNKRRKSSFHPRKLKKQPLRSSFANAWNGIAIALFEERNLKIHCFAAVMVLIFGNILHISVTEWCICFILFGLIMGMELVNTAVESVVDLVTDEWKPLAKRAKDCAAGAVFISSIWAAATGGTIFFPKLYHFVVDLLSK